MSKKLPYTPNSKITSALRKLWLQSRERNQALKNANRYCEKCGVKASTAKGKEQKLEVHHKDGVTNWQKMIDAIREYLLVDPKRLKVLCPECHKKEHEK